MLLRDNLNEIKRELTSERENITAAERVGMGAAIACCWVGLLSAGLMAIPGIIIAAVLRYRKKPTNAYVLKHYRSLLALTLFSFLLYGLSFAAAMGFISYNVYTANDFGVIYWGNWIAAGVFGLISLAIALGTFYRMTRISLDYFDDFF